MTYSQLNSIPHRGSPYEGTGPVATAISIVSRKVATDLGSTDEDRRELDLRSRGKAQFLVDEDAGIEVARILQDSGYSAKLVADLVFVEEAMKT
jgi:hypothetical protein